MLYQLSYFPIGKNGAYYTKGQLYNQDILMEKLLRGTSVFGKF